MITLFRGQYTKDDYEYLHMILDEVLTNHPFCVGGCECCKNLLACKDLHRLHRHISKVLANEYADC